jgi:hypothetical protein
MDVSVENTSKRVRTTHLLPPSLFYFYAIGIPIKTIANFKKMKMISEDLDTVVAALKAEPSDLIEVNDEQQIRRKTEVKQQDHESRSIYAVSEKPLRMCVCTQLPCIETLRH